MRPCTWAGTRESAVLLSPSWPVVFCPQHHTELSGIRAHEWPPPADITGSIKLAAAIGATEVVTKSLLYYLHERAWLKIPYGRKNAA